MFDTNDFNLISVYTRAQAIADGVLVDVSDFASQYGFKVPVAITGNLFNGYVKPDKHLEAVGQALEGRLHDVLMALLFTIRKSDVHTDRVCFKVKFLMDANTGKSETVKIISVIGGGDSGECVLTIMLPEDE